MAVTRKTSYALRALSEIAATGEHKPVNRQSIAERQNISSSFLERILIDLKKSHLIKSVRGPGGGFILNKNEGEITVWDVFSAVEKSNCVYEKCSYATGSDCENSDTCNVKYVWEDINNALEEKMLSITLKQIIAHGA